MDHFIQSAGDYKESLFGFLGLGKLPGLETRKWSDPNYSMIDFSIPKDDIQATCLVISH